MLDDTDPRAASDVAKATLRDTFRALVPGATEAALDSLAEAAVQDDAFGHYSNGHAGLGTGIVGRILHSALGIVIQRRYPGPAPSAELPQDGRPPADASPLAHMVWARSQGLK